MKTDQIQNNIKFILKKIGWSQKKFARAYYCEITSIYNETEMKQFEEKLKKHLQRSSTPIEQLKEYEKFLLSQDEATKIGYIIHENNSEKEISSEFDKKMSIISRKLTQLVQNKDKCMK